MLAQGRGAGNDGKAENAEERVKVTSDRSSVVEEALAGRVAGRG
jgi:hypothetical protein